MSIVNNPTPRDFMEQVVAWPGLDSPGYINLHWLSPKGPGLRGKPFKELPAFMDMAQYAAVKPATYKEVFFCLSTQAATGKEINGYVTAARSKPGAVLLKAIWLDVDVKKDNGYGTITEALRAINEFCRAALLPPPSALVLSGGGVHVYWISSTPLPKEEWRLYAEWLKAEAIRLGLKCDAGLTTDEARVLRVPGTFNNKTMPPRVVKLAHLGDPYVFGSALAALRAAAPVGTRPATAAVTSAPLPFDVSKFTGMAQAFAHLDPNDSLDAGIRNHDDRPLDIASIKGCAHFQDALDTHGAKHGQELWSLTLLASAWLEDGRTHAHNMSKGYPSYDPAETDKKYDEKLHYKANGVGWPSCSAFEGAGAKCKTCPFYGKVKSPLNLAARVQPPAGAPAHPAPPPPDDLFLPDGYTVDPHTNRICEIVTKTTKDGHTEELLAPLFMCRIRKPEAQRGTRKWMFEASLDGGTYGKVSLLEASLATDNGLMKALRDQGVKPYPRNKAKLEHFMTSWMAKYDDAKRRIDTISFGWLRNEAGGEMPIGFAYGGRVILVGGAVQSAGFTDSEIENNYKPKGAIEPWYEACKIVTDQNHAPIEAIIAAGFAAPLLYATGKYNALICSYSPDSGAHKSTSMGIGAAIWGSPKLTKERPMSSKKGIVRKLGAIRNLPLYWDEIIDEAKMDEVRENVGQFTEGGGGSLLHQDRSFYKIDEWQTLMLVGSNRSLCDNIMRNVNSTDASLQRVFEFVVPPRPDTLVESDVSRLIGSLDYNYGGVGLRYSEMLGRDPTGIYKLVRHVERKFDKEVDHVSKERFRSAMASTLFVGAVLGNRLGCEFHLPELWDWLKEQYMKQRGVIERADTVAGTDPHTANTLTEFFKVCVRNCLWVQTLPLRRSGRPDAIAFLAGPSAQHPDRIEVRLSVNDRVIDLSRKRLMKFLTDIKASAGAVERGLIDHYGAEVINRVDLATGSGVAGGRETIIRLPVPAGSTFEGILFRQSTIADRPLATEDEQASGAVTVPVTDTGIC